MKKIILILALFTSIVGIAQNKTIPVPKKVANEIAILKDKLQISDLQASRLTYVLTESDQQTTKATSTLAGNKAALQTMLKELHDIKIKNLKGGLTDTQSKLFDELKLSEKF